VDREATLKGEVLNREKKGVGEEDRLLGSIELAHFDVRRKGVETTISPKGVELEKTMLYAGRTGKSKRKGSRAEMLVMDREEERQSGGTTGAYLFPRGKGECIRR